jgi:hypothetical protein
MPLALEDVVNQALVDIGYAGKLIGDIYEGSMAARTALEIYNQTRDEILDAGEWPFARRANVALTLLKGPPPPGGYNPMQPWTVRFPPPGWLYEYAYPDDCLDLRAIIPPPTVMFDLDPVPALWRIDDDDSLVNRDGQAVPEAKVILTNTKNALAIYEGQITDPQFWEPGFVATLVKRMGEKLSRRLVGKEDVFKDDAAQGAAAFQAANEARG